MAILDRKKRSIEVGDAVVQTNTYAANRGALQPNCGVKGKVVSLGRTRAEIQFDGYAEGKTHKVDGDYLLIIKEVNGKWIAAWDEEPDEGRRLRWEHRDTSGYDGRGAGQVPLFQLSGHTNRDDPKWLMRCLLPGHTSKVWKHDDIEWLKDKADQVMISWGRQFFPEINAAAEAQRDRAEAAGRVRAFVEARRDVNKGGGLAKDVIYSAGTDDGIFDLRVSDLEKLVEGL